LKGTGDLLALRNHLLTVVEQADSIADPALRAHLLSFVVAGGGFAGVEMCAAIAEMLQVMRRTHPVLRVQPPQITLVHSGRTLLPQLRPRYAKMAEYATRQLTGYGVKLRLGVRLAEVQAEGALLSDGTMLSARTVISTVGQALIPLAGTETLGRDEQGRLLTDAYLHVQQYDNVWTGGDVANVVHARTQTPCPSNALWAIKHGERVGDNIARAVISKPIKPFTYPGLGQAASMGIGKGMTELYGMQFTGWIGWVFRLCFFLYFMPSRAQAVRVAFDWLTLPVFGRHLLPLDYPTAASSVAYKVDLPVDTHVPEPIATLV
jgi:NADH dehydrogenase